MSGLNWMYCGPFGMILTDSLFLVTSEEKEKEVVSGECSSISRSWRPAVSGEGLLPSTDGRPHTESSHRTRGEGALRGVL